VPRVGGWFTRLGAATMTVYLCHGFVVKGVEYAGFPEWASGVAPTTALSAATAIALVATFALGAPRIRRALDPVIDPVGHAEDGLRDAVRLTGVVREQEEDAPAVHQQVGAGR
jgi:fucose 4-O-acetylase-like acetyltransferase